MAAVTFIGHTTQSPGGLTSPITFTGVSIGTAAADRKVSFVWKGIESGLNVTGVSATIGGVAATLDIWTKSSNDNNGNQNHAAIFSLDVPTGTTATIVLTFTGSSVLFFDSTISVYAITGCAAGSAAAINESHAANDLTTGTVTPKSLNVNVQNGGAIIAGSISYNHANPIAPGTSWTGLTEDDESSVYGTDARSVASLAAVATETPRTVSVQLADRQSGFTLNWSMVCASYNPAAAAATMLPRRSFAALLHF